MDRRVHVRPGGPHDRAPLRASRLRLAACDAAFQAEDQPAARAEDPEHDREVGKTAEAADLIAAHRDSRTRKLQIEACDRIARLGLIVRDLGQDLIR